RVGASVSRRSGQRRLAPCGKARRLHQSKTAAPPARQLLRSLGEIASRPGWLGDTWRRAGGSSPTPTDRSRQCSGSILSRPARSLAHSWGRCGDLSGLVEPVADSTTIPANRLEYRRQVDRQGVAVPLNARGPSSSHPPTGQPWLSPPPFRPRRLPSPQLRAI